MIHCSDSLEFLKQKKDFHFDIHYADVPYALGSEVFIQENGKPEYKKAVDFMDKWQMPNGVYWEQWFNEAFRTLKHGGYCLIFGIDRQLLLFKYYAAKAGFIEQQSLYWYFISNFPKASDLSKNIDKHFNADREIVGKRIHPTLKNNPNVKSKAYHVESLTSDENMESWNITAPATEFAKKYDGYKYSISPLKQTNETIMVFQKPYKTGSCLHDTLVYENGDNTCSCGALNIDGNRVPYTVDNPPIPQLAQQKLEVNSSKTMYDGQSFNKSNTKAVIGGNLNGRYPPQTFVDSLTGEILDKQSGNLNGGGAISKHQSNIESELNFTNGYNSGFEGFDDNGGCSKILHKCDFESGEFDIYHYCSKVSSFERNAGCELNNHPTLKPISLNFKILSLFKSPNKQHICYPFAGSGSEIIGGLKAGFEDYEACEINQKYIEIANARIKYWTEVNFDLNKENHDKNIQNSNTIELNDLF